MRNKDTFLALGCIIIGFAYRLIPGHPSNVTPVATMALVGGMYMSRKWLAFVAPILALYVGDLILNNTILRGFYPEHSGLVLWSDYMAFNILAMAATVGIGFLLMRKATSTKILAGGLAASILFFFVTNFGSWLTMPIYPKTIGGLLSCLGAGIPFFRNTLIGNFVFVIAFIGAIDFWRKSAKSSYLAKV